VLPAVSVFGLGLAATVAPVTSAALAAVPRGRSGLASGVNNAASRTAQLAAVAAVPWAAGLHGDRMGDPEALAEAFPVAMMMLAGLAMAGAAMAWATIADGPLRTGGTPPTGADQRTAPGPDEPAHPGTVHPAPPVAAYRHCAVDGAPLRVARPADE